MHVTASPRCPALATASHSIEVVVGHEITARMRHGGASMVDTVSETIEGELASRGSTGGIVAIAWDGRIVVTYNPATILIIPPRCSRHSMTEKGSSP